jgi:hypothetical protein
VQAQQATGEHGWTDIWRGTVPSRTHRKTVIEMALKGQTVDWPMTVRVLDAGAARETQVEIEHLPPRLRIG